MKHSIERAPLLSLTLAAGIALASCGGGGGGGGGSLNAVLKEKSTPNDSTAQAQPFGINRKCVGSLNVLGDVDYWSVQLTAGRIIAIELFGSRLDQPTWRANLTLPRLSLYAPDGLTRMLYHDYSGTVATNDPWGFGKHDLDVPAWRVPQTGRYFLRLESDDANVGGGAYAFRLVNFTPSGAQAEGEAQGATGGNDTPATAQAITPGSVSGWSVSGEVDYYSFTLTAPSIAHLDVTAYRNGAYRNDDSYLDSELELYAGDGTTLLNNNDDAFFGDPALNQILPAGSYFVAVSNPSDGDGDYLLGFSTTALGTPLAEVEPNETSATASAVGLSTLIQGTLASGADQDFYSFTATAGDMIRVWAWDEDNSSLTTSTDDVTVDLIGVNGTTVLPVGGQGDFEVSTSTLLNSGTFYVRVTSDATPSVTDYHLRIERFTSSLFEAEPNNTISVANKLGSNGRASGIIGTGTDFDLFEFSVKKNRLATLSLYVGTVGAFSDGFKEFSGHGSDLRPFIVVKDSTNTAIASSSTGTIVTVGTEGVAAGLPVCTVSFVAPANGKYYAEITTSDTFSGATYSYVLELR
jgi:hypothetical protein